MRLTAGVVICAYTDERWDDIVRAVRSAQRQSPKPDQVVLVIDHNHNLLARALDMFLDVTVCASIGKRGLSGARNTGIARCHTDIVAFLDDDAAARAGWLDALVAPFADRHVAATGGRAVPVWPTGHAPSLLPAELLWIVGCTYEGQPTETADVRNVMGCSMAFRRSSLDAVGGFVDGIGRRGSLPLGCEETELCIRVRQHDLRARVVFAPAALVDHRVSLGRTSWRYLIRRSYAEGVSKALVAGLVGAGDALSSERAYTRSVLPRGFARELRAASPFGALAIFASLACAVLGFLRGQVSAPPVTAAAPIPQSPSVAA